MLQEYSLNFNLKKRRFAIYLWWETLATRDSQLATLLAYLHQNNEKNWHQEGLNQNKSHENLRIRPLQVATAMIMEREANTVKLPSHPTRLLGLRVLIG